MSAISNVFEKAKGKTSPRPTAHSEHEEVIHPNQEADAVSVAPGDSQDGPQPWAFVSSGFVKWFIVFDETRLRPFLIRNYDSDKAILQDELYDLQAKNIDDGEDDILEMADRVTRLEERRKSVMLDAKNRSLSAMGYEIS